MPETRKRPRILLVDDDADLLVLIESRLASLGSFDITTLSRPREVLNRIQEIRPDLIVSDIDMPGMDGGQLAAALREREAGKNIPILFLSSMVTPAESQANQGRVGGWPMFSKKAPIHLLAEAIVAALGAKAAVPPQA
jgi:CheY-like chemotaxis protein